MALETETAARAGHERLHALDALRASAMLLGVILHAGMAYMITPEVSWPKAKGGSPVFDICNLAIHGFRMQIFFLIAGFFGRLLLNRLGPKGFIRHRAQRIALPFVLGMLTVVPLSTVAWNYSASHSLRAALQSTLPLLFKTTGHLWFLYLLIFYYAAGLLCLPAARRILPPTFYAGTDRRFVRIIRSPIFLSGPILLTMAPLLVSPSGLDIGSSSAWIPSSRITAYYALFYGFGWLLHRNMHLLQDLRRGWAGYAAVSFALLMICIILTPYHAGGGYFRFSPLKIATAAAYGGFTWSAVFAVTILFLQHLDHHSRLVRYVADASYWFYLAHLPIVLFLQDLLNRTHIDVFIQFFAVLTATLFICAVTYHFGVRFTWIGTILNGRRKRVGEPTVRI